jgi:hypothetical protein
VPARTRSSPPRSFSRPRSATPNTRRAYARSVARFPAWCEQRGAELHQITPGMAGEYLGKLTVSPPTKNQTLAALRHFFDVQVSRHAVLLNPFASVRGVRHSAAEGSTPEIGVMQAPARRNGARRRPDAGPGPRRHWTRGTPAQAGFGDSDGSIRAGSGRHSAALSALGHEPRLRSVERIALFGQPTPALTTRRSHHFG